MLVIHILLILHKVGACCCSKFHFGPNLIVLSGVLGILPVILVENRIAAHWHIVMGDVELINWIKLSGVETHGSHIIF